MSSESPDLENGERTLKGLFDDGMILFEETENTKESMNSPSVQELIRKAMNKFEDCTRLVSLAGVFSTNEGIEEVPTDSLCYLLLPALLGSLSLKICSQPRAEVIRIAEIYFRDFLQRCKDYGVGEFNISESNKDDSVEAAKRDDSELNKITALVMSREAKIRRYKEMKELNEKVLMLKLAMNSPNVDEQTKREYFMTLLLSYINQSLDELQSIEAEKPILKLMEKRTKGPAYEPPNRPVVSKKLKPIIITKDAVQKAVFGLGYPSIPTVTIEEFYENRIRDGTFPGGSKVNIPHKTLENVDQTLDEVAEREKETNIENDDPETLAHARDMDEFKDDHRRGWGNRHNRS